MKSLYLFIILILLILVVYYHNKSLVYEKVEHFDDNVISQIASIINGDTVKLNNVELTGTLTTNDLNVKGNVISDLNIADDKQLKSKKITTRTLYSTGENGNYIDFMCGLFSPEMTILNTEKGHLIKQQNGTRSNWIV